mmetsp:Transcript_28459/g.63534  ORF Transcript_28459/g.63534 Transcript_28459/m.63534 type:complete len:220 (+) Transcript_28459:1262-1921(+)
MTGGEALSLRPPSVLLEALILALVLLVLEPVLALMALAPPPVALPDPTVAFRWHACRCASSWAVSQSMLSKSLSNSAAAVSRELPDWAAPRNIGPLSALGLSRLDVGLVVAVAPKSPLFTLLLLLLLPNISFFTAGSGSLSEVPHCWGSCKGISKLLRADTPLLPRKSRYKSSSPSVSVLDIESAVFTDRRRRTTVAGVSGSTMCSSRRSSSWVPGPSS